MRQFSFWGISVFTFHCVSKCGWFFPSKYSNEGLCHIHKQCLLEMFCIYIWNTFLTESMKDSRMLRSSEVVAVKHRLSLFAFWTCADSPDNWLFKPIQQVIPRNRNGILCWRKLAPILGWLPHQMKWMFRKWNPQPSCAGDNRNHLRFRSYSSIEVYHNPSNGFACLH